jgi:hypothetical protein
MPQAFAEQIKSVPMTSNLGESLDRALSFARIERKFPTAMDRPYSVSL